MRESVPIAWGVCTCCAWKIDVHVHVHVEETVCIVRTRLGEGYGGGEGGRVRRGRPGQRFWGRGAGVGRV